MKTIVLGVTGSIACYKACELITRLRKRSYNVRVLLTKSGERFVTPLTLQILSRNEVIADMFAVPDEWNPRHTAIAESADLVIIAPATANIIGKLASGICDDMLTCTAYATKAPVLIAPAMHANMYNHPVTQANIKKLKSIGYNFVGPVKGSLACGMQGIGHIADTDDIFAKAARLLK